ncbi:MAG: rhomboid family intramembrane serine protease [Rickettsiales bacterium]|nr:rhomboid family intramembrane serine protease [Rickettsiales bacterium]RPG16195.1 MAG: rhomboid family intramembrane serine protease [Pelagibacteraceae bacterium TMED195]
MIPLKDENKTQKKCYIRLVILIVCALVFFSQILSTNNNYWIYYFGFKPLSLFQNLTYPSFPGYLTLITSLFLHGGWMHFLGNMLYLWIFADNVEDKLGAKRFVFFYLISGVFASLTQAFFNFNSEVPMIGASGSIAGVLGAYLFFFPRAKVLVLIPFFIFFTVKVPAYILLIFWFLYQFLNLSNIDSSVAWLAHIGGFIFGYFFAVFSKSYNVEKKGKTVFLDKDDKGPWD